MITEQEAVEVLMDAARDENDGLEHDLRLGPLTIVSVVSAVQVSMFHPDMNATQQVIMEAARTRLMSVFPEESVIRKYLDQLYSDAMARHSREAGATAVEVCCVTCGSNGWVAGPDNDTIACKNCGHAVTMDSMAEMIGAQAALVEVPEDADDVEIPVRVSSRTAVLRCPVCDGSTWNRGTGPNDGLTRCKQCETVYSQDAIMRLVAKTAEKAVADNGNG